MVKIANCDRMVHKVRCMLRLMTPQQKSNKVKKLQFYNFNQPLNISFVCVCGNQQL